MTRPGFERGVADAGRRVVRRAARLALPVLALAAVGLSGCGSISEKFRNAASQMPGIGLPAGAPERAAEPVAFPAVHDMPPPRNSTPLTVIEQEQMEKELVSARDVQQTSAGLETQAQRKAKKPAPAPATPARVR